MDAVVSPLGILGLVALVVGVAAWYYRRATNVLEQWAEGNGYELLSSERCWCWQGPFFWTTSESQEVFYVTIRTPQGETRRGWVRCGGWLAGLLSNEAEVRWDD